MKSYFLTLNMLFFGLVMGPAMLGAVMHLALSGKEAEEVLSASST
jgi:hypothetical protein